MTHPVRQILLGEDIDRALDRARALRAQVVECGVLLFGAGNTGAMIARRCQDHGLGVVRGFVDDTPGKDGKSLDGIEIFSRSRAILQFGAAIPIVSTIYKIGCFQPRLLQGLAACGFTNTHVLPDFARAFEEHLMPYLFFSDVKTLMAQENSITELYDLLADDTSRETLSVWLHFRLTHDYTGMDVYDPKIYFPDVISNPDCNEFVFVDCGAYDGDSIKHLLDWREGCPAHAIAFEPDPNSFTRMKERLQPEIEQNRLLAEFHMAAVGAESGEVGFAQTGDESSHVSEDADFKVKVMSVDDAMATGGWVPDYIKYDVEGFEAEALRGTRNAILSHAPNLAISMYHRADDLWVLPLLVKGWRSDYKFYLRTHGEEGMDTVLYAIFEGS